MREIDRGLIVLHPRQPFVDWLNSWSTDGKDVSLEEAGKDGDAFLIPEFESEEEAKAYVRLHATQLLEHVLEDWCPDKSLWPAQRNYVTFCQWFDVSLHSTMFDMVEVGQNKHGSN